MIPHPILNSRRDDASAIELRIAQRIDCTKNHFASDAVEDTGGHLPHDTRTRKTPCRARAVQPVALQAGLNMGVHGRQCFAETTPSEINACTHAFVSPSLFHLKPRESSPGHARCGPSETITSMDVMISLRTAPSETRACMHTFVSLRSRPHSRPQNGTSAFMDVPDRFGLGGHGIGPAWMNRYSDEVGSVTLNRFRRDRSRIEAHHRLNRSPSHTSTHRLVRRIRQDSSTTR